MLVFANLKVLRPATLCGGRRLGVADSLAADQV
jgi:hypothetical protein